MTKNNRKPWSRRKRWVVLGLVPAFVLAGTAAAAWLLVATGSTTSTLHTGTAATAPVTLTATSPTTALTPGGAPVSVALTLKNPGTTTVQVAAVTVSVTATSAGAACPASDFVLTTAPTFANTSGALLHYPFSLAGGVTVHAGGSQGVPAQISLKGTAPTSCQNVTVNLSEKAS